MLIAVNTRPATTAKIVAKAIADTKANKKSPPNALANKGGHITRWVRFNNRFISYKRAAQILRKSS